MDLIDRLSDVDVSEFARSCFRQEVKKVNDELAELLYMHRYHQNEIRTEALTRLYWKLERIIKDYE